MAWTRSQSKTSDARGTDWECVFRPYASVAAVRESAHCVGGQRLVPDMAASASTAGFLFRFQNDPSSPGHLQVGIWINEQHLFERRFADQEIFHTRKLVLRAVHPHDLEG
jgi:hypothetical protein